MTLYDKDKKLSCRKCILDQYYITDPDPGDPKTGSGSTTLRYKRRKMLFVYLYVLLALYTPFMTIYFISQSSTVRHYYYNGRKFYTFNNYIPPANN